MSGDDLKAGSKPPAGLDLSTNEFRDTPFNGVSRPPTKRDSMRAMESLVRAEDLSVVFQPIVDFKTLEVFAYEALVRCSVPSFKYPPALFERAVLEQCTGRLGRMVREVGVPLCAGHPIFLNLHPLELEERWIVRPDDPMFFHDHDVYLEVTESVPMSHFDLCRDVIKDLRSRGPFRLVVDDLGAGFSNLKHIADLEPAIVKLDRGLIMGVTSGSRQQKLVKAIVRLCVDMGAEVVGEGIETYDEYRALADTGVHYGQGFLFARPGFPLPAVDRASMRPPPRRDER